MIPLIRGWTDVQRTPQANTRLGVTLAAVAGAANAGGFLAVHQYTSHMTGVVSGMADALVLGQLTPLFVGLTMLFAFAGGAMCTAILVNLGLRRQLHSAYGLPLLLESALLLVFGLFGGAIAIAENLFVPLTVVLLCFIMGLQNAVITKISRAEIRTTHLTGLVTDMGIELGKLFYMNTTASERPVRANRDKLRLHGLLIGAFSLGAVLGAFGFKHVGYASTLPLAFALLVLIAKPLWNDVFSPAAPHI
ncbi:MAG: YoaK family protein [Rhodoferax sp.]|nr:YoaK family protein [Rhodoferax sp.]